MDESMNEDEVIFLDFDRIATFPKVSEEDLKASLVEWCSSKEQPDNILDDAMTTMTIYIFQDLMSKNTSEITFGELNDLIDHLILQHTVASLVEKDLVDVVIRDDGQIAFKPSLKGKKHLEDKGLDE